MEAYQWVFSEVPIECGSVGVGEGLAFAPDDTTAALLQVAYTQRRQIGRDNACQLLERGINESCAAVALLAKTVQCMHGSTHVELWYLCKNHVVRQFGARGL